MRHSAWRLALAALCAAAPAAAQQAPAEAPSPPAADSATIVVTADTPGPATRRDTYEQAREVSRISRFQLHEEALPRFETPLCPAALGLRDDYAAEIVARIRDNAARLELPVAAGDCTPNLLVAFMDDGRSFLTGFEREHPRVFRKVAASERDELLREPAPVRVWNHIALRWTGAGDPPVGWPRVRPSVRGQLTRGFMPEAKDIVISMVLFDREAVVGMTLTQLADYATMRGLSHTRPARGDEPLPTILAMFEDGTDELTAFDVGYLRSLYDARSNLSAASRFVRVKGQADRATAEAAAP